MGLGVVSGAQCFDGNRLRRDGDAGRQCAAAVLGGLVVALLGQFRADLYNVFNNSNLVAPPSMQNFADSPDFGALFVARSPRIVQLGFKFLW